MLITKQKKQMIKLVEVVENAGQYNLREIVINSAHVTSIAPEEYAAAFECQW